MILWFLIHGIVTLECASINYDILANDQQEVCSVFNNFFVNVAKDIGSDSLPTNDEHPSIIAITSNFHDTCELTFTHVDQTYVNKQIDKLNCRKATGNDGISSKLLKLGKPSILGPLTNIINKAFDSATFPEELKIAQVRPIHKKNSTLEKR